MIIIIMIIIIIIIIKKLFRWEYNCNNDCTNALSRTTKAIQVSVQ